MIMYLRAWIKYYHDLRAYKRACKMRKYLPRAAYNEMFVKRVRDIDDQLHATYTAPSPWQSRESRAQATNREILERIMNTPPEED